MSVGLGFYVQMGAWDQRVNYKYAGTHLSLIYAVTN